MWVGAETTRGDVAEERPNLRTLRADLHEAAANSEPTERLLEVAAVIAAAFADLGVQPVVVGGLAVAYWSDSEIVTGDIDVLMPRMPELAKRLEELGFVQDGREWMLPGYEVAFEAPGEMLEPGDEADEVELASGRRVRVLSIEDLLLWRLREWIHWHVVSGFRQAAVLLINDIIDKERLGERAAREGLALALTELRRLTSEIESGVTYEDWELAEIGKSIEEASYSSSDE